MAFGAPDHVRKQDVNVTDYNTVVFYDMDQDINPFTTWSPVDITGIGSAGLIYFQTDYEVMVLTVEIDGELIFWNFIQRMFEFHVTFASQISNHAGVTRYDEINSEYSMWVDFHYLLPFKKSLKIKLFNADRKSVV